MTSLIFGTAYLVHGGIVKHHREKQRQKNYQRWENLRDEYDEMKKVTSQRPSGEYQRQDEPSGRSSSQLPSSGRELFTLRDQQEANDARTSWRPQEGWEQTTPGPGDNAPIGRRSSVLKPQKTGATWDEGLPQPLNVGRRSWDDSGRDWSESQNLSTRRDVSTSSTNSGYHDRASLDARRRSPSVESEARQRKEEELHVVESPYEWWK